MSHHLSSEETAAFEKDGFLVVHELFDRDAVASMRAAIDTVIAGAPDLRQIAELEPGDAVFFHCLTLHAAQRNASNAVKLSLVHTYHPDRVQPLPGSRSASRPGIPLALAHSA